MRKCPTCQSDYTDEVEFCPHDTTPLPWPIAPAQHETSSGLSQRYRIVRRLGEGGMGTVFLAEQIALGSRPVALKVLRRNLLADPDFLQRFREEAASTGRIRHQNVVTVYESGQADDGSPYIAMEYLDGHTLGQTLKQGGALSLPVATEVLQQAARGLNAAHRLGIIHRDVKPDNIFLTQNDEGSPTVKVLDFGIAKMRESSTHTMTGLAIGTPAYISPEQAQGMRSEDLDGRSDIYSLGIVAYEMLTGRVPFQADTPLAYVRQHLSDAPPPLDVVRPGLNVPPLVEKVVLKALAKDRSQRYMTAVEFAHDFAQAVASRPAAVIETAPLELATPPLAAVAMPVTAPVLLPPPRSHKGRKLLVIGVIAALFLAAAAASVWYAQDYMTQANVRVGGWALLANGQLAPDFQYAGPCPVDLAFRWDMVGTRPAAVTYFVTRSDGSRSPGPQTIQLPQANQFSPLVQHWQLGNNGQQPAAYTGWAQLNMQSPTVVSSKIPFTVRCQAPTPPAASSLGPPVSKAPPRSNSSLVTNGPPLLSKPPGETSVKSAIALGDQAFGEGNYDQAIAEYKKGLASTPSNEELLARLASAQEARHPSAVAQGAAVGTQGTTARAARAGVGAGVAVSRTVFFVNGQVSLSHQYDGPCPADLTFQWDVAGTDATPVVYSTVRSDGSRSPGSQTINLRRANASVPIVQHWRWITGSGQFGSYGGWVQLNIESPNSLSTKIPFAVHCR